ncbi:MAG: DUF4625 domain-containing protein [Bacteroidetes bacterium]|nr:MAG: DUF4625 domain-containing protein [Bacteroidota bacterium]
MLSMIYKRKYLFATMLHLIIFATMFHKTKIMKRLPILVMALGLVLLNACSKGDDDKDTTKPVIKLSEPTSGDVFVSGEKMNVSVAFEDNKELSQYKIEIHDDFDRHAHLKTGSPAFTFTKIVAISSNGSYHFTIDIPADVAAGPYHFIVNALDKAGNEADFAEAEFTIKNSLDSIAPTLNITASPSPAGGVINLQGAAKTITLNGTAGDNESVKSYEVKLIHKASKVNYIDKDGTISGTSANISETITFDDAWPDGDYLLVVEVYDLKNNRTEVEFDVMRMK